MTDHPETRSADESQGDRFYSAVGAAPWATPPGRRTGGGAPAPAGHRIIAAASGAAAVLALPWLGFYWLIVSTSLGQPAFDWTPGMALLVLVAQISFFSCVGGAVGSFISVFRYRSMRPLRWAALVWFGLTVAGLALAAVIAAK